MIRNGLLIVLMAAFALNMTACSSKDKKEETEASTEVAETESTQDSETSEKTLTFNPEGSDSGAISGLETVNFEYDKASLTSNARTQLEQNADWIKKHPEANVQIEGHCDASGSVEYNLSLGERRAQSVKQYLVSLGVDSKRLSVISYGEEKLLTTGDSESDHARNRRANFVPIPR